jgi:hypothetical protein
MTRNYTLDLHTPLCHRTAILLRLPPLLPLRTFNLFVAGLHDGDAEQSRVNDRATEMLDMFLESTIQERLRGILDWENDSLKTGNAEWEIAVNLLRQRWEQVTRMVEQCMDRLKVAG